MSAKCHFSWKRTVVGILARARDSGVSHSSGRYSAAPSIQARTPVQSAAVPATWQLATLPSVPQDWTRHGHGASALLGETRAIGNQHAGALGDHGAQLPPDAFGAPGRVE